MKKKTKRFSQNRDYDVSSEQKLKKRRYALALVLWAVAAVGIYTAAMTSKNIAAVSAITTAYTVLAAVCAAAYAVLYCKVISLRKKCGVSPDEKFDFESCGGLSEKERRFLRNAQKYIKAIMVVAVPVLLIIMADIVLTFLI